MLFALPQSIVDKPHWKRCIRLLLEKKLLRLVAVDKIQLYVHYGLLFRTQFDMLSITLFKQIRYGVYSVLFLTASSIREMYEQLQLLTGLRFYGDKRNFFGHPPSFL